MREPGRDTDDVQGALASALARGDLRLHYQPIIRLGDRSVRGVEALARWHDPVLGPIAPVDFIPVAESSGLIVPLGAWALRAACTQGRSWQVEAPKYAELEVAVNLSAIQLADPHIVDTVDDALAASGLRPEHLELEITEGVFLADRDRSIATLTELRRLGVSIVIDDFGTGYSSLGYLKDLPIDGLKVDKSFVDELHTDPRQVAMVGAVVAMATALGLNVVAEGVETIEQAEQLAALGCSEVQGYYFARPQPADDLLAALVTIPGAAPVPAVTDGVSVLVCDDDPLIRRLYRQALSSFGAIVVEASDAPECVTAVATHSIDLVLLDIGLPGTSGLDVLPELRRRRPGARIVVVSGVVSQATSTRAIAEGADECVPKMQLLHRLRDLVQPVRRLAAIS